MAHASRPAASLALISRPPPGRRAGCPGARRHHGHRTRLLAIRPPPARGRRTGHRGAHTASSAFKRLFAARRIRRMFMRFFTELRQAKVPVTLKEYLALMEGMDKGVIDRTVEDFYYLSRTA